MKEHGLDRSAFSIGITCRLFLVLLVACLITATGVALATRLSFQQGFIAYLDQREVQRIEAIAFSLATAWESHRSWDFVRDDDGRHDRPPAVLEFTADCRTGSTLPRGLVLYDNRLQRIAGNESGDRFTAIRQPIMSHGAVVGTLVGTPRRALSTEAELRFQQRQIQDSGIVMIALAFLAALLAAVVARGFLTPIRGLIMGATEMAHGNYGVRVCRRRNDELGTLATCFNTMAATLQDNEIARQQFMANVSHELRAPLAILHAELEAMKDGATAIDASSIVSLREETHILTRLVNDIRQLYPSTVGELKYEWQELDLAKLLEEERNIWHNNLAATGIAINIEGSAELRVLADRDRLRQLLRNLIDNVRRHAAGASLLLLRLRAENDSALIECHDNGHGMTDELTRHLFDGQRLKDRSPHRSVGGSGLGLAICHNIIIAHGGRIEAVQSTLGGLCIRMYLPLIRDKI